MTKELESGPSEKMIQDYNAVSARVAALRREAAHFGANFKSIGYALINAQHSVAVARGNQILVTNLHGRVKPQINVSDLDPNRLVELLKELEETTKERERLFASLREVGAAVH